MNQVKIFKTVFLVSVFMMPLSVFSQKNIVSSGGNATGTGGSMSYTIGQVSYKTISGSNGKINEGVQQPIEIFVLGNDNFQEIKLEISLYPNPATSILNLNFGSYTIENFNYQIFDNLGKSIKKGKILKSETQLNIENFSNGIYLLQISNNQKALKTFKIIKRN